MHVDTSKENIKTAVYYCNTNNGSTLFQNGKKVLKIQPCRNLSVCVGECGDLDSDGGSQDKVEQVTNSDT